MKEVVMREHRAAQALALGLALVGVACGHPEQKVVDQYFMALNAQDTQTLSSFAVVSLDTKGKRVDKWAITSATDEVREPAPLPELVRKLKEAEAGLNDNNKQAKAYALDNLQQWDDVRELLKKGSAIPAKLKDVADKYESFNAKDRELKKAVAEAKEAVEREKRNVSLSLGAQDNLEDMTGELASKTLDLALTIGGETSNHAMTLRKYDMSTGQQGPRLVNRWVIYSIQPKA
jgi:hypothetical protein